MITGIASRVKGLYDAAERMSGWLLAGGLVVAALGNLLQWRRDRRRLAQLAGQQPTTYDLVETPRVSILLPAWNEAANIEACVESILSLRYPDVELIVCAGGGDGTLDLARRHEGSHVIVLEQRQGEGKQGALRRCYAHSTGDVIFLTDADCILDDRCFEGTLGPVIAGGEDAATGSWQPLDRQMERPFVQYQWSHHVYRETWMPDYAPALDGRNAAVKRSALEAVAAFEVDAPIGTDLALSKQLEAQGYVIRFVRDSQVQTAYPGTLQAYRQQQSRWFRNPLVHQESWLASPTARNHLRAGLAASFLVFASVPAFFSQSVRSAWVSIVLRLLLAQLRMQMLLRDKMGDREARPWPLCACKYVPMGWVVMAEAFWSLLCCPQKRERW